MSTELFDFGLSFFESRTPSFWSFLIFFLSMQIPAMTSGPIIEPLPASSTPHISTNFDVYTRIRI